MQRHRHPRFGQGKAPGGCSDGIGKGKRLEDGSMVDLDVKAGDRILFGKYSGNDITLDGTEYIIMREDDVLGVLDAAPHRIPKRANSSRTRKLSMAKQITFSDYSRHAILRGVNHWPTR